MLLVLVAAGARRGEVCALRWSDIDTEAGTVLIRRSIASVGGGTVEKDTTLNVYAHFLAASDREAANVMGGLLKPRGGAS